MKTNMTRTLYLLATVALTAAANGQGNSVDLYMQPEIQAQKVAVVSLGDPRLGQPTPVIDEAKAVLGWHFAEFEGMVEGYAPDAKIGKDLLPVDGAIIYSGPSSDSPVLGVYRDGSDIETLDTGAWWKFQLTMKFPVYFILDSPSPLPAVTGVADEPVAAQKTEVAAAPVVETQPVIQEMTVVDSSTGQSGAGATGTAFPSSQSRKPTATPPDAIGQSYQGIFKLSKRTFGLFKPFAPFYLESADGNRIAWIDTSNIVIPGSLKGYLDKTVIIHGEREFNTSNKEWVIHARNMRLK
jgi:hypothetical protein